ncbi:MAG: T9SS type A sorting domain-containing protein [Bacteroidia bacterium]|nr:T9SS type A sorting domain-containing protein [Bacteroidota bacterium]MBP6412069.1 T9SS type A sorting domain-containing protein [Bacteroidia bacterium]
MSQTSGINNYWLSGYQGGISGGGGQMTLNFDTLPLFIHRTPRKMNFDATNASISDRRGNLLFYSNGGWIANSIHDSLSNGRLPYGTYNHRYYGEQVPQESLFLESPGDTNIYFMFYNLVEVMPAGYVASKYLYYLRIDKRPNNGLGAVIQKNISAINDTLIVGEITSCKHGNGRDWWVICHRIQSNLFYKVLLTPQGVSSPTTQYIGDTMQFVQAIGQAVFSPDGTKYASYHAKHNDNDLLILDFDRCSGTFSNPIHITIDDSASAGGVAFSPNSQLIYVSSINYVYQFDVAAANIPLSKRKIATYDGYYSPQPPFSSNFFLAQLAPDGKIYINSANTVVDLHVINQPDSLGLACDLVQHSFHLPALNAFTIPNHPNYFLRADSGSVCDTLMLGLPNFFLNKEKLSIDLYPNPSNDKLIVSYQPIDTPQTLEVVDISGKTVLKSNVPQWSQYQNLDISKLFEGVYLCRLVCRDKIVSAKFVISR